MIDVAEDMVFVTSIAKIVGFGRGSRLVTVIEDGKANSPLALFAENDIIFCLGEQLLFCPHSSSLALFSLRGEGITTLCQTLSRVVKVYADKTFKIVVVSTIDGFVRVFDLLTGDLVRAVDIGGEAMLIGVTPKWGLIVVYIRNEFFVLNVNGLLLKREKLTETIVNWFTFSSQKDFDVVVYVTASRKVGVFDPLHPEMTQSLHEMKDEVVNVFFDPSVAEFMIVSKGGHISVVPHQFSDGDLALRGQFFRRMTK
jgi:hypothetical protein